MTHPAKKSTQSEEFQFLLEREQIAQSRVRLVAVHTSSGRARARPLVIVRRRPCGTRSAASYAARPSEQPLGLREGGKEGERLS
jgi:hypothetical protein